VLKEKETKLSEYENQLKELSVYKEKADALMSKQIEELENKIPEGKKEFLKKIVE